MKKYKKFSGTRVARRRRRRILKSMAVTVFILLLVLMAAPAHSIGVVLQNQPERTWERATKGNIAYARNRYILNGPNGDSLGYTDTWPEFTAYIVGEKDIADLVELPDGTVMP